MNKTVNKKGITLLIATLTAGVLLSISLAIFNIAIKELVISSVGRESQVAFYAADSGIECALYQDAQGEFTPTGVARFSCGGNSIVTENTSSVHTFTFTLPDSTACVTVSVDKSGNNGYSTIIESRGHNSCEQNNPRRTERGLRIRY